MKTKFSSFLYTIVNIYCPSITSCQATPYTVPVCLSLFFVSYHATSLETTHRPHILYFRSQQSRNISKTSFASHSMYGLNKIEIISYRIQCKFFGDWGIENKSFVLPIHTNILLKLFSGLPLNKHDISSISTVDIF